MAQVEQLFLLEILIDNIKLNDESIGTEEEPIRVRVKFIEFPWFEIDQHQELQEDGSFNSGKSHLFPMAPVQLIKNLQRYPLAVTVLHVIKENPVPDLIGQTRVKMTEGMTDAVQSAMHCNCNTSLPITYTLKDTFSLRNIGGEVGTISLFIRLTCFGQSIVTQFQLGGEKKAFLFQHSKADNANVCKQRESKLKMPSDDPTENDVLTSSPFLTDEDTIYEDDCPCGDGSFMDEATINWKLPPPPPPPPAPLGCGCAPPAPPPVDPSCDCSQPAPPPEPQGCRCSQPSLPPEPSGCRCSQPELPLEPPACRCSQTAPPPEPSGCRCSQPAPPPEPLGCRCSQSILEPSGCGCPPPSEPCPLLSTTRKVASTGCSCGSAKQAPSRSHSTLCSAFRSDDNGPKCGCDFEDGDVTSLLPSVPTLPTVPECTCGFADNASRRTGSTAKGSCGDGDGDGGAVLARGKFPSTLPVKQIESSPEMKGGDPADGLVRKPSIRKETHDTPSAKRVSVLEAREQKVKKKRYNFSHKFGVQYPGVKYGHLECVLANCQVPPHMGWLWNAKCPQAVFKPRRKGWRPGAIGLTIAQIINRHRRAAGLSETNRPQKSKFKRGGRGGRKDGKGGDGEQPPTLHVHRKDGAYYISMHPLNIGGDSEQIPLEFTIPKRTGSDYESESTESELEFDFMAPGAFEPKKPPVKFRSFATQYLDKDCNADNLQLKGGKGKDKKGKGKGKGSAGSKKGKKGK